METAIQISSAAATVEGPLEGETGHGLVHLPDANVFALAAGADGRPADNFSVRILSKALRIAFRPKDGMAITSLADKALMVRSAIRAASDAIATQPSEKRTGGATLAVVAFDPAQPGSALVLNVGDSRCYRFRNSRPECLTRSLNASDTAQETPLLMDVLNNAIGGDEPPEIEEQTVAIEPGDVFVLIPGSLFRLKPDLAVGRALRRVPGKGADVMAASLVEEALKTESAAGIALVVKTETVGGAATAKPETETPATPEPDEAPPAPAPEPTAVKDEGSITNSSQTVETQPEEKSKEKADELADANTEAKADDQPTEKPTDETPAAEKTERVEIPAAEPPKPARNVRRTPRKTIVDESSALPPAPAPAAAAPAPVAVVAEPPAPAPAPAAPEPKRETVSTQAVLAAAASLPPRHNLGPLARKPLLHAEAPNSGKRVRLPLGRIAVVLVVLAVLAGAGWGVTQLIQKIRASSSNEFQLEEGATAASVLNRARISGEWGQIEKALPKLPALATGDEDLARAWIAQWNAAAAPEFPDATARLHLDSLGALVTLAGGAPTQPVPAWNPEKRADEFCRIAGDRQRALHGAIEAALQALNRRGDIPFEDHTVQNATLAGIGRFTKGRHTAKLDAITRDFATARTAEGQLEALINLRKLDLPLDSAALQRSPGEPLRQLNTSLDRAWDGLLEVITASAADSAQWKRTAPAALAPRFNRLDAIRQNVLTERRKFGDVRRWRTSPQGKQLVIALLTETAKLGNELNPAPAPAAPRRR